MIIKFKFDLLLGCTNLGSGGGCPPRCRAYASALSGYTRLRHVPNQVPCHGVGRVRRFSRLVDLLTEIDIMKREI